MKRVKHVVITGSSRGIGFALARAFLELGWRVTVSGRSDESTQTAIALLRKDVPGRASEIDGLACDVAHTEQIEALWRHACSVGPVDIWINNAGVSPPLARLWEVPLRALEDTIDTNVRGMLLGTRVALAGMREQGCGALYNLEGFGADGITHIGAVAYGASKSAVGYVSKCLAREARGGPVVFGAIDPGAVRTDMTAATWYTPETPRFVIAMIDAIALDPPEVARLLAPRIAGNRRTGVRIRPWNSFVAWARVLFLPIWGLLVRRRAPVLDA